MKTETKQELRDKIEDLKKKNEALEEIIDDLYKDMAGASI